MGACSAQRCSHLLQAAPYAPLDLRRRTLMGGHGFVNAFLEIKGSPVPYSGRSRSRLCGFCPPSTPTPMSDDFGSRMGAARLGKVASDAVSVTVGRPLTCADAVTRPVWPVEH